MPPALERMVITVQNLPGEGTTDLSVALDEPVLEPEGTDVLLEESTRPFRFNCRGDDAPFRGIQQGQLRPRMLRDAGQMLYGGLRQNRFIERALERASQVTAGERYPIY